MDGFERQATKAYGQQRLDRDVGASADTLDEEGFADAIRKLNYASANPVSKFAPGISAETRDGVAAVVQLQRELRRLERQAATSEDPDELMSKTLEKHAELTEAINELLPSLRTDWSAMAAHHWRTRLDSTDIADYDTMGPASNYTNGRSLPPEADILMQDYYKADPLDAVAEYLERSTRRVEYAKRFGAKSEVLQQMMDSMRDDGVTKADRALLMGIVNNATGRENHSAIPGSFVEMTNTVNHIQTMYLLGRASFASLSEPVMAFARTRQLADLYRPIAAMVQDVAGSQSALERRAIANIVGLVSTPHADALMANRMSGETYSKMQSLRMGRFFERTLLGPLSRAQQRALITVGPQYMLALSQKPDHAPSRAELGELGIAPADQAKFAAWLESLDGKLPMPEDLIDRNTDELHSMGTLYGTALKRFTDQVIMEPSKMDKPKLASNPVARFAYGIMSFTYTFWNQVQKPFLKQIVRDGRTLLRKASGQGEDLGQRRPHGVGSRAEPEHVGHDDRGHVSGPGAVNRAARSVARPRQVEAA